MKVYKYELERGEGSITLPFGAKVLHFGEDGNQYVCVWALVDPESELTEDFHYEIYGTGHPVPDNEDLKHKGTVVTASGLVWHLFQKQG